MNKSNASIVREFYNRHFFDEKGKTANTTGNITLKIGEDEIAIRGADLHPGKTIGDIFEEYHFLLKRYGDFDQEEEELMREEELDDKLILKSFKIVEYRKASYLVEERAGDVFYIQRQDNQKVIDTNSIQGRTILKKFREE